MDNSSIIEKIANLLQLAEKNNNANESAAAAKMAQKLLTKYRLTKADLLEYKEGSADQVGAADVPLYSGNRIPTWKRNLASTVARVNGCRIYFSRTLDKVGYGESRRRREYLISIVIVGFAEDIKLVRYFFHYLFNEIERLSDLARERGEISGKRGGNSFKIGASQEVCNRLWEAYNETKKEAETESSTALVHLNNASEAVNKFYSSLNLKTEKRAGTVVVDPDAVRKGRVAGRSISLNKALK